MALSVGSSACYIGLLQIRKFNDIIVVWYIPDDKELYQKLSSHRDTIENDMGVALK